MKLFIGRLKEIGLCLKEIGSCFKQPLIFIAAFWSSYFISTMSSIAGTVIIAVGIIALIVLISTSLYMFINWLFIEPFFTKKGVDRK